MANKMLIDATHPEETRVATVRGQRLEDFDFESASRKPLRGNIYLAKVTRVEPSLQAAFVEYGGNRHGFLAFAEIHPDYYQIPVADRQALLEEELQAERDADEDEAPARSGGERSGSGDRDRGGRRRRGRSRNTKRDETVTSADAAADGDAETLEGAASDAHDGSHDDADAHVGADAEQHHADGDHHADDDASQHADSEDEGEDGEETAEQSVEQVGGGDARDDMPVRRHQPRRQYKIQEVIKRRQILLVQVVKEERGNKGAALTTYLSLAGRYSVLMPNTGRGGGISRKITSAEDRRRLKELVQELEVPDGMGIILRTAGASRTKPEIGRDYDYLMRMWESVREATMTSSAPALVYEEGSLVKRTIRDLYNKEIDEILVAGESSYREAKDFMRMLMPSHARMVKPYRETQPLFAKHGLESQLDSLYSNTVTLKSGGYIVINQAEALVAIDINSGRSTREHNIEDTALKTNLEAADEIARQLRLRDLAGLIVIDFIDMEEHRNNRAVEKRMKDALRHDRARIQVGRISAFGLLEMSRQRIRTGVLESSSIPCPHCAGTGLMRSNSSIALQLLRAVEEALIKTPNYSLNVKTRGQVAMYILNQKRGSLRDIEERFGVSVLIEIDERLAGQTYFQVERGEFVPDDIRLPAIRTRGDIIIPETEEDAADEAFVDHDHDDIHDGSDAGSDEEDDDENGSNGEGARDNSEAGKRRRRRRRRGGRDRDGRPARADGEAAVGEAGSADTEDGSDSESAEPAPAGGEGESEQDRETRRRRRRGRRGGRRTREEREADAAAGISDDGGDTGDATTSSDADIALAATAAPVAALAEEPIAKPRRGRKPKAAEAEVEAIVADEPASEPTKPRARRGKAKAAEVEAVIAEPVVAVVPEVVLAAPEPEVVAAPPPEPVHLVLSEVDTTKPKRGGWWSRK
jgi:ribonuclease E